MAGYGRREFAAIRDYSQHLAQCRQCTSTAHYAYGSQRHATYLRTGAACG
ncbi:hypothetical protein [Streptomyces sp. NPDC049916]